MRELQRAWASPATSPREALAEVFGELDERTLIAKALQKKLRGRPRIASPRGARRGCIST